VLAPVTGQQCAQHKPALRDPDQDAPHLVPVQGQRADPENDHNDEPAIPGYFRPKNITGGDYMLGQRLSRNGNDSMKPFAVAILSIFLGALCFDPASFALAASDCSMSATLANWGEKSTAHIAVAPKESCQFPLKLSGTISSSEVSQKPSRGKLKKIDTSTYLYTAKARYRGTDTFAITATGRNETTSGTSEVLVDVTIK